MSILFMEGFDGYASAAEVFADERMGATEATSSTYYDLVTGRSGSGNALQLDHSNSGIVVPISSSADTFWVQGAFQYDEIPEFGEGRIVSFVSSDSIEGSLRILEDFGTIQYCRGDVSGTVLGSGPVWSTLSWTYFELKVYFHASAGTVLLKMDGVEQINLTSQNTLNSSSAIKSLWFGKNQSGSDSAVDLKIDDLVIGDNVAGSPSDTATDLLGDCSIEILHPSGVGNYSQFSPVGGSPTENYQNVDEGTTQDGDTSYNSSSTAGHKDSFTCDNLAASSGTVYAVQVTTVSKKGDGGGRKLRGLVRESATDATGTGKYVPASYTHRSDMFENDPSGTDWTVSTVNSMEIGYELET